jgi:DNA primase
VRAVLPKSERRRVTGNEQRALRNLVMFPRIAHLLDAEDEKTLFCATRNRELFEEVLMHARALGDSAQFTVLSELLRASNHAVLYEEIFREILVYDENVRDVMLHDPGADAKRHLEQERVAGEELQAAVARLRYDGWCGRLNRLSQQGRLTLDETAEFSDLSRRAAELKKRLAGEF